MRYPTYRRGKLAEDLHGQHVTWTIKGCLFLAEVTAMRYESTRGTVMLQTRYLNGEAGPEVSCGAIQILEH